MIEVEIKLPLFRRSVTERTLTEFGFKPGNLVNQIFILPAIFMIL